MIYKTQLGVSYLKTRNSTYNKLLTRTYLQTLFSINDQQLLFFIKKNSVSCQKIALTSEAFAQIFLYLTAKQYK